MPDQLPNIQLLHTKNWEEFVKDLRSVPLLGDPSIFPYQAAEIENRLVQPDEVMPLSKYVIEGNLEMQRKLHQALEKEHQINSLDLKGEKTSVIFTVSGEEGEWVLSPPIIEESTADGGTPVLLDGEHRFLLARELGVPVRVIWIKRVPAQYPVVALPIPWSEVKMYKEVPALSEKRRYRFPTLESFPDISSFSKAQITPENFLYFWYRDLTPVCTSSVRKVGSK